MLVELLCFLDNIHRPVFLFKTQRFGDWILSPSSTTDSIDWAQLSRFLPEEGDRIQSTKRCVLNKKQDDG
jgi:hypothetical protein